VAKRELGTVLSWNQTEGSGQIQPDSGTVLWAHFSFIQGTGFRALSVGQRVEFTRIDGQPGPPEEQSQARDITSVDSPRG
jgi:CspA family cold shock protein